MRFLEHLPNAIHCQNLSYGGFGHKVIDGFGRLVKEIYPDAQNQPRNSLDDCVRFEYNRIGEVVRKTDQNGTVHSYDYDDRGRLVADHVTALGLGVDGAVRKIGTGFAATGNVETITSYDSSDVAVNQIRYEYGSNGLLRWEFTAHDGEADVATTPYIEYRYGNVSGGMKPVGLKYPGGRELSYSYDAAGRVVAINEGVGSESTGGSGSDDESPVEENDVLVRYGWQGLGSAMKVEYVKPGLTLDYTAPGALDRFGRIADHRWKNGDDDDIVRIQHGYDVTGNRMNRQDVVTPSWSETYGYDEMSQVATMNRTGHSESWQYDPAGNWMRYKKNNVVENRNHNAANEILTGVVHDANGNMTRMPSPKDGTTLDCVYDAWNRLVAVGENIRYEYDGRNHRIKKTVGNVVTNSFFNHGWQELESRTGDVATTYVWGLRYIDDLVLREKGHEKLYSLADPNWNVAAVVDEDGVVEERFKYDAFGKVSGLASDWDRTFTGQVLDGESGFMLFRIRYYSLGLGRFVSRDAIAYEANDVSLYRYLLNAPNIFVDPYGLTKKCPRVSIYNESGSDYGGNSAGGNQFKCLANYLGGSAVPMNGRGLWAATMHAAKEGCCIDQLDIIDHGVPGSQWVGGEGEEALEKYNLKELCDSLCDGAKVVLYGCNVANPNYPQTSITELLKECPKLSGVTACTGPFMVPGEWRCGDCSTPISTVPYCSGNVVTYTPMFPPLPLPPSDPITGGAGIPPQKPFPPKKPVLPKKTTSPTTKKS